MTREEAIANLNMISVAFVEPVTKEQRKLIDDTFEMAIKALEQEPKWIPVSERLPNEQKDGDKDFSDWVQVSIRINPYQSIVCSAYYCFSEKKWYMERFGCGEIVAWMPLPKPYERG